MKWNREEVIRKNKEIDELFNTYEKDEQRLKDKFYKDLITAIKEECDLSENKAKLIYAYAYNNWHSCFTDMLCNLEELCDLIYALFKTE